MVKYLQKTFDSFKKLYEELVKREFEIIENEKGILIARYNGNYFLRKKDKDLEVKIRREKYFWALNTDERFYGNRIHISLGEKMFERTTNSGGICPIKRVEYWILDKGVEIEEVDKWFYTRLEGHQFCFDRCGEEAKLCEKKGEEIRKLGGFSHWFKGFEISYNGFSDEEVKLFKLPKIIA